jgi:hypothetical protein
MEEIIMEKKKKDNNDVVLKLDRIRVVRFTHRALKRLSQLLNKPLHEVIADVQVDMYDNLETYMLCGLMKDAEENGEVLKLADVENLLDQATEFCDVTEACQLAFMKSLGYKEDEEEQATNEPDSESKN